MILSNFYKAILAKLTNANVGIKYIDLWNDQIVRNDNDQDNLSFNYPAVFLEFEPIEWTTLGRKKQSAEVLFNLIVASENLHETSSIETTEERNLALDHLSLIDNIFGILQGFYKTFDDGSAFGSITRLGTAYEHEAANEIIVHGIPFKCRMTDVAAMIQMVKKTPDLLQDTKII